jgi:hypothetical protein
MHDFLTDDWFEEVARLNDEAQPTLDVPRAMADVIVNLTVASKKLGQVLMCLNRGLIAKGHFPEADVDMSMPEDYAYKLLVLGDWSVGMKGYLLRKIKLSGNMRKMIPLQFYEPGPSMVALREKIEACTGF